MSQPTRRFFRFAVPGASWLDVKLAMRMLFKQPGLTLVAIFALAIGIPVGLLPLHVLDSLTRPLPVEDGEEIVMVRNYDRAKSDPVMRPLHDFVQWREELSSFEDLGMWRTDLYNVNSEDGRAAPVRGADVTASIFVPPARARLRERRHPDPRTRGDPLRGTRDTHSARGQPGPHRVPVVHRVALARGPVRAARGPREGWAAAAKAMRARGDDHLLDAPTRTHFDDKDWQWR